MAFMKRILTLVLVAMLWTSPSHAQSTAFDRLTPPLPTDTERTVADVMSWVTVGVALGLDARQALKSSDPQHQMELFAVRVGTVFISTTIAKEITKRTRPDGSDNLSFYSMHTAFAASTFGGPRYVFTLPLTFGSGGLRIAAGRHYLTDVLAGLAVGAMTSRIRYEDSK